MDGIDPYSVLQLPKNSSFTVAQLKAQYKALAEALPVKKGEDVRNTPAFQILTGCYRMLLNDATIGMPTTIKVSGKVASKQPRLAQDINGNGFDVEKFNKIFEQTKVEDAYSKASGPVEPNYLKKVNEPSPAQQSGAAFYELGKEYIEDWSGDNLSLRDLNYSDFRVAYTTDKLVDESTVRKRKEYKSIAELERDRANISFNLSDKEKRRVEKAAAKEKEEEKRRQQLLERMDQLAMNKAEQGRSMFFKK